MRIGVACNCFARSGGMEQYALNVISALIDMGHTPVVFTMASDSTLPMAASSEVHVCPEVRSWLPNKVNVCRFNRWLRKVRPTVPVEFLIACCHAVTADIAICGGNHIGYLKAMKKTPRFYDQWIIDIERDMYENAGFVVAHAGTMYRELQENYGIDPGKMRVIYPPQTFKVLTGELDRRALRSKFGLPQDKKLFLFPSSSHKRKGIELLRRYFENTPYDELLVVAGRPLKHPFKNAMYVGFCKEMQQLYHACDYTVLASFYDPLGTAGLESVWNGTPSIMGANIGCCEVLDDRSLRSFDVNDFESFARVMANVREHPIHLEAPYQQYIAMRTDVTIREHVQELMAIAADLAKKRKGRAAS